MPKEKKQVNTRIPIDIYEWVSEYADLEDITVTDVVIGSLLEFKARIQSVREYRMESFEDAISNANDYFFKLARDKDGEVILRQVPRKTVTLDKGEEADERSTA